MIALVLAALTDLTRELLRAFPLPAQIAEGSSPVIALPEVTTPGLVRCSKCGTLQRPLQHRLAVHFAKLTDVRPCVGSWP